MLTDNPHIDVYQYREDELIPIVTFEFDTKDEVYQGLCRIRSRPGLKEDDSLFPGAVIAEVFDGTELTDDRATFDARDGRTLVSGYFGLASRAKRVHVRGY